MVKNEKKEIITKLQELAKKVLELKETRRQKRPIIIEFSGSPKSGKTSSINSLELFLKRNGFKVEIIQERASVCPVLDKQSPMFNIWTSCMSIAGMIGALEKKDPCDILILDRGIFDAFCWFEWLRAKNKLEKEQQQVLENFLAFDAIVQRIDIVFSFKATPEKSIEREFANLLTDKPGTIMNTIVLGEYLEAIKATISRNSCQFHKIVEIDTTEKNQDEVGKEVTSITLNTLNEALMERIGYITPNAMFRNTLRSKRVFEFSELRKFLTGMKFDLRDTVESDISKLQPLPIAVLINTKGDEILLVKKTPKAVSQDSPEKDNILLYVGGHTRVEDFTDIHSEDFISICKYALKREIKEELGVMLAIGDAEPFLIYTPDTEKSKQHLAICFVIKIDTNSTKLKLDSDELVLPRGATKSGRFFKISELATDATNNFESWSIEIAKKCFDVDLTKPSLFDFF